MDEQMKPPEISTRTDLRIDEARDEYVQLSELLKKENKPKYGWMRYIQTTIDDRLDYLRRTITDLYVKEYDGERKRSSGRNQHD